MPYQNSSSDEEEAEASSSRKGRRLVGRNPRRRRRGDDDDSDSSVDETSQHQAESIPPRKQYSRDNTNDEEPARDNSSSSQAQVPTQETSPTNSVILDEPDSDTLRILISTDNHLGYAETDNVRGNDSFAALEEVLYLAKEYSCDMVMLAGDLFHENRPSRRTLFKTMDIFRRYCMGPGAIQVQVVSGSTSGNNSNKNRSPFVRGYVNYEDSNYSVDLPVFSIHGNHDDPSRDGGNSELYAALDLLDVVNLVNYFGKQEDTQDIRVDPILLRKGNTKVALYGLGSMRDERLNRMWRGGHLTFSRPQEDASEPWFNIFALHQNRDRGRGTKNCVKEDMIPEWIDFVCWGHEHECDIELTESVVGTFRISQPGSSVATSLVEGESVRKKVAVLDVREGQFRLTPIPLTQVRSFVVSSVKLAEEPRLDPDDPKVESKVSKVLEDKVRVLIHDAREKRQDLLRDAKEGGNGLARFCQSNNAGDMPLKHTLHKEDEVLVRLKVDHTGFAAVNNQRFGAKFVGEVANPTDILLFHRKKTEGSGTRGKSIKDIAPIEPSEIEEMNIEELIVEQFESNTAKLELFDDKKISLALDSYVGKQEARAINEALEKLLGKQQDRLIKSEAALDTGEASDEEETARGNKQKSTKRRAKSQQAEDSYDDEGMEEDSPVPKSRSKASKRSTTSRKRTASSRKTSSYKESDSDEKEEPPKARSRAAPSRARGRKAAPVDSEDDDDVRMVDPPPRARKRTTKKPIDYSIDVSDEDDDNVVEDPPSPTKRKRGRATAAAVASSKRPASKRGRGSIESIESSSAGLSQSQLSFQPVKRKAAPSESSKRKPRANTRKVRYTNNDSDSGDSFTLRGNTYEDDGDDWGTAKSGR